jgi:hypothetical protein
MPSLGAAAEAAHTAFWAGSQGGKTLSSEHIQKKLVPYFVGRGEALVDLPTDVDVDDVEGWKQEWEAIAASAGISDPVDCGRLVKWLQKRSAGPTSVRSQGVAGRALETLEAHGVSLSSAVISELEKNLASGEAGDVLAQSTSCLCVGILYTGKPYEPEDCERWERLRGSLVPGQCGTVNICGFPNYILLQSKSANITLERALKHPLLWEQYLTNTLETLQANGLPKAASRLHQVVGQARKQARSSEPKQRD